MNLNQRRGNVLMKHKYIEERFRRYFVFGENEKTCDITDGIGDIVDHITHQEAEFIINDRNKCIDVILKLSDALEKHSAEDLYKIMDDETLIKELIENA